MEVADRKPVKSFQDLRVWQSAYELTLQIYRLTELFPRHEAYGLTSQMTRAAVSVCSNIAEGFGRRGSKEKDQFYAVAKGSLTELENQILIAQGIGYGKSTDYSALLNECDKTHRMLRALQNVNSLKAPPKSQI